MKGLAKFLMAVALLIGAAYGGTKSYIYYQARDTVETLARAGAPFVAIEYGAIGSDLWSGTVRVERIKLTPTGINDSVHIDAASLRAGNLRQLFGLMHRAKDWQPPEALGVALKGVRIDLKGELVRTADRFLAKVAQANPVAAPAAHCGYQSTADLAFFRRLGYEAFVIDLEFDYDYSKRSETVKLVGTMQIQDMTRVEINTQLSGLATQPAGTRIKPQLREFGMLAQDLSYNDRLKTFCAQAAKLSEQEYIAIETGPHGTYFKQLGIVPGPGLQQAYRDYLTKQGGTIALRVRPSEDLDPTSLALFKPADILAMLNATLSVNGKSVQDLSFELTPVLAAQSKPQPKAAPEAWRAQPAESPSAPPPAPLARERPAEEFRVVQVADLGHYMNRYVRLHERGQSPREGTLVQVTGRIAVLERRYGTGHIVVKVPLPVVEKAEVKL